MMSRMLEKSDRIRRSIEETIGVDPLTTVVFVLRCVTLVYLICGDFPGFTCNAISIAYPLYITLVTMNSSDKNVRAGWLTFWCFYGGLSLVDRMTHWDETVTIYWLAKKLLMEFVSSSEKYGSMAFYNYFLKFTPPIPVEMWALVSQFLPVHDKMSLSMVSRCTNEAIRSPIAWSDITMVFWDDYRDWMPGHANLHVGDDRSCKLTLWSSTLTYSNTFCINLEGTRAAQNILNLGAQVRPGVLVRSHKKIMDAAVFFAPRLTSVSTLRCMTGRTDGRCFTNDFLQLIIEHYGFPNLTKLCSITMDERTESHFKMLLDSNRPIQAFSMPFRMRSTAIPWRLSRITYITLTNVHENCTINIGRDQLQTVKLNCDTTTPEFILKQRSVTHLEIEHCRDEALSPIFANPQFCKTVRTLKTRGSRTIPTWQYVHDVLDQFPAVVNMSQNCRIMDENKLPAILDNYTNNVVSLLKKLLQDGHRGDNTAIVISPFDFGAEATAENRKLDGCDEEDIPFSPAELSRGNEIGVLLQPTLPYSISDCGESISASVTVHCAWTEYVSYVVYKVENGVYSFSRGKYPETERWDWM